MTVSEDLAASTCRVVDEDYSGYECSQLLQNVHSCIAVQTDHRLHPRTVIVIGGAIVT
jgi:hypothetical protein